MIWARVHVIIDLARPVLASTNHSVMPGCDPSLVPQMWLGVSPIGHEAACPHVSTRRKRTYPVQRDPWPWTFSSWRLSRNNYLRKVRLQAGSGGAWSSRNLPYHCRSSSLPCCQPGPCRTCECCYGLRHRSCSTSLSRYRSSALRHRTRQNLFGEGNRAVVRATRCEGGRLRARRAARLRRLAHDHRRTRLPAGRR